MSVLRDLMQIRERMLQSRSDPQYLMLSEQRDAFGLLLEIGDLGRPDILGHCFRGGKGPVRSFLDYIPETGPGDEGTILQHDMSVFGDWKPQDPRFTGTRRFSDGKTNVTIMCINATPAEAVTGVDLIYHIDGYDSFVVLQYKRMVNGAYRPDERCHSQSERMQAIYNTHMRDATGPVTRGEPDFWLSRNPFFFKVCTSEIPIEHSEALIEGMYFPLDHWQQVVTDPSSLGPRKGISISRKTAPRWLSSTEFVDIAKKGWIGSTQAGGRAWVSHMIQQRLSLGRALVLGRLLKLDSTGRPMPSSHPPA